MVKTMIAAAEARPPGSGAGTPASAETRGEASSTGTPRRLDMTRTPPAGRKRMTAGDGRAGTPGPGRQRAGSAHGASGWHQARQREQPGRLLIAVGGIRRTPGIL